MLPEAEDEKREEPKTVDLQQPDSAKLEKEAMNSIQHQSEELEKYLEPSSAQWAKSEVFVQWVYYQIFSQVSQKYFYVYKNI